MQESEKIAFLMAEDLLDQRPRAAEVGGFAVGGAELVERFGFRAFDLAYAESSRYFSRRWPDISFHLFTFSNAYALAQVGTRSVRMRLQTPDFEGIRHLLGRHEESAPSIPADTAVLVK